MLMLVIYFKGLSSQEPALKQQVKTQEARVKEVAPDQNTVKKMQSTVEAAKTGITMQIQISDILLNT